MVETAKLPELKLRPQFRADAEVKFMATLSKPKKVTGVRSGRIPLVRTTKKEGSGWPAGNPTATKHVVDTEHYEFAEDEPFYASKEVERLEDNLIASQTKAGSKKSDIIERITESRRQRHKNALEDLHEELGHLNKAVDPQVSNHLDSTKEQISWILSEIRILFSGIENDHILYTYPLKRLQVLWEDVVTLLQKRSNKIVELREELNETEVHRKDQISELLKHYSALFHDIAYLNTDAINLLMDLEVHSCNELLLSNYTHYANIISQIQLENVVKLREYRVMWEERLATWRDLHTCQTTDKFTAFMNTPAITECPDIKSIAELMRRELRGLVERRFNKLQTVRELKPPSITSKTVLHWYEDVCELSLTLENTHRRYVAKLAAVGDKVVLDCEGVADRMLATLQDEGVCSADEAQELKVSHLVPLIEQWAMQNKEKTTQLEQEFSDQAAKFNSNLHLLYDFQNKAATIWTEYCARVNSKNNELSAMTKKCRLKHDEVNQQLESALDMEMDKMRQDTNDIELKKHLDKATEALDEIAAAYSNFKKDMADVIKTYPDMISTELLNYSVKIRKHLGCYTEEEEVKEEVKDEESSQGSTVEGIADKPPKDSPRDEPPPEGTVFMTEVGGASEQTPSYSDERFRGLEEGLVIVYLEHLDLLTEEVAQDSDQTVEEKLSELKSEVELRHHIHKPRATRMKLDIYNVRLNELKNHEERVKQHGAGITLEISTLRNEFKDLGAEHNIKGKEFKQLVEECEAALPSLEKTAHLHSLQTKVNAAYEEHMNHIKLELSTFRNKMECKLNDLRESNQHFGLAFKPFAEGGNFGPDEIETYRKKLEKCNLKIDNCETFILTELDGMESKCLDAAVEMTNSFEMKLKMHILDVAFLEKVNSWMSNCQVRIKTEVAACNMMSKKLKTKIESLRKLIDSCARPHPDKPVVKPEEVLVAIPDVYNLFQQRISYLNCAKPPPQTSVKINPDQHGISSRDSIHDFQSVVNLTKNILQMSRKYSNPSIDTESITMDKKKPVPIEPLYEWFIVKQEKEKPASKRGKSRVETAERTKRLGSASSRSSMMSIVLTDVQSFMPMIKKILQETQGALFVSSEAYYSQYQGPPLRSGIAETLEGCMDELNKRLNNYYLQTLEFYNKCIQDLRSLLTDVVQLHIEVPSLLFNEILEKYVTEVSQKTSIIKHEFDQNKAKIKDLRETNKVQLKPILGHPNNEVDLNNLCRREEDRSLESGDVLSQFYNEITNTERTLAQIFVESINNCTQRLMHLFDQLITTDDVILGKVAEEKLPTTTLLKRELRAKQGDQAAQPGLSREGQQIKLLRLADIAVERTASSKSEYFKTSKFTPGHEEALLSKDKVSEEYKERFGRVMGELDVLSSRWTASEDKWKRQWLSSVQHVRNLYKPASMS